MTICLRRYSCLLRWIPGLAGVWSCYDPVGWLMNHSLVLLIPQQARPPLRPLFMVIPPSAVYKHRWRSLGCSYGSQQYEFQLFQNFIFVTLTPVMRKLFLKSFGNIKEGHPVASVAATSTKLNQRKPVWAWGMHHSTGPLSCHLLHQGTWAAPLGSGSHGFLQKDADEEHVSFWCLDLTGSLCSKDTYLLCTFYLMSNVFIFKPLLCTLLAQSISNHFLVTKILIVMKSFCCGQSIVLLDRNLETVTYVYYKYLMSNIKPFLWLDLPHLICKENKRYGNTFTFSNRKNLHISLLIYNGLSLKVAAEKYLLILKHLLIDPEILVI